MRRVDPPANPAHAGLVLYRYYAGKKDDNDGKRCLGTVQRAATNSAEGYEHAFKRRDSLLIRGGYARSDFATAKNTRVAVGLGIDSPLEIGLRLHYTYGMPVLPGPAIKGVTAAYCRQILNWQETTEAYGIIFGNTEERGLVDFEDAWLLPNSIGTGITKGLVRDVVTPHHPRYYSGGSQPLDSDEPTPVAHLAVAGTFRVAVRAADNLVHRVEWQERALDLLAGALMEIGIGGRTRAGYGRMIRRPALA